MAHAGGRPSKYSDAYCNEVIQCLAEGKSVTAFAGRIGVARSTVFKWADEIPEFSDALKVGQAKATEFWEEILIKVAKDGGGNATAAIFGLKNRASDDWHDKHELEHTGKDGAALVPVLNVFTRSPDDQPGATPKAVNGAQLSGH